MEISSVKKIWHLPDFFISIYYMKIYSYLFPFIISCFFVSGSFAATEEKSYGPEQEYTAHFGQSLAVCTSQGLGDCPSGERCGVGGSNTSCIEARCQKCSDVLRDGYDYSDSGAYNREGCFKYCVPEDVKVDGETVGQKEPSVLSVCYPSLCPENDLIYCKNESDECNGYHAENGTCVSNVQPCEGEAGKGFQLWDYDKQDWTECRLTECEEGFHLEPTETDPYGDLEYGFACDGKTIYGKCVDDEVLCSEKLDGCEGYITKDAVWTTDGAEIKDAPGKWDFSNCRCETDGVSIEGGIGETSCPYEASDPWGENTIWKNGKECDVMLAEKCDVGYCQPDGTTGCQKAPAGYYHDNTADFKCQPCPIGATSAVGSMGENCCYMRVGSSPTRFCDSVGCFDLSDGNIPYDNTKCETVDD